MGPSFQHAFVVQVLGAQVHQVDKANLRSALSPLPANLAPRLRARRPAIEPDLVLADVLGVALARLLLGGVRGMVPAVADWVRSGAAVPGDVVPAGMVGQLGGGLMVHSVLTPPVTVIPATRM